MTLLHLRVRANEIIINIQEWKCSFKTVESIYISTIFSNKMAKYKYTHVDFNLITTQVTITATNTQPCVRFEAVADSLGLEGVENLTLTLTGPPNVQLISPTADICIQDSDGNNKNLTNIIVISCPR